MLVLAAFALLSGSVTAVLAQEASASATDGWLFPGKQVERSIKGGEVHRWRLPVSAGQAITLRLQQEGQDLKTSIQIPVGSPAVRVDRLQTSRGVERCVLASEVAGIALFEVRTFESSATEGHYFLEVRIDVASEADHLRAEACRLVAGATIAMEQEEAEGLLEAGWRLTEAVRLWRRLGDRKQEAMALRWLAKVRDQRGEKQEAVETYGQALAISQAVGDPLGVAVALQARGTILDEMGEPDALADLERSLALYRGLDDIRGKAKALGALASAIEKQVDRQRGLKLYKETIELCRAAGDLSCEGAQLHNMGQVYSLEGRLDRAVEHYEGCLKIWQKTGQRRFTGWTLHNLGAVQEKRGDPTVAIDYYERALKIWEETGDLRGKAFSLHNLAVVHSNLGESQRALDLYAEARELIGRLGLLRAEAQVLQNLGVLAGELGLEEKALEYYSQSLEISQRINWRLGEGKALGRIGRRYTLVGELDLAENYLQAELAVWRDMNLTARKAGSLHNLGDLARLRGELDEALELARQSLTVLTNTQNRQERSLAHRLLSKVYRQKGELDAAEFEAQTALYLSESARDVRSQVWVLQDLARISRLKARFLQAVEYSEEAVARVERLRQNVSSPRLRRTFFSKQNEYYFLLIDSLVQLELRSPGRGFGERALEVSEQYRARTFLDLIGKIRDEIDTDIDPELWQQHRELSKEVVVAYHDVLKADEPESMMQAERRLDELLNELKALEERMRALSPRYEALHRPPILSSQEVLDLLEDETLLVEYFLGSDASFLWAVSKEGVKVEVLPGLGELEPKLSELRRLLAQGDNPILSRPRIERLAMDLGKTLLSAVGDLDDYRRLVIVPDGPLHYLPFSMLGQPRRDTYEPILVNKDLTVVTLPSASVLPELRRDRQNEQTVGRGITVLADPVFSPDDPRVMGNGAVTEERIACSACERVFRSFRPDDGHLELERLPSSRREAAMIAARSTGVPFIQALDFDASLDLLLDGTLEHQRLIHFATHALVNDRHPELSSLVLSLVGPDGKPREGLLMPQHLFSRRLAAELVVLSACNTALGEEVKGEGLVGLSRAFMFAGVPSVVATLWRVEDRATAKLMEHFYDGLLRKGMAVPKALAFAQRKVMRSYASPRDWAGFVVLGDWKAAPITGQQARAD